MRPGSLLSSQVSHFPAPGISRRSQAMGRDRASSTRASRGTKNTGSKAGDRQPQPPEKQHPQLVDQIGAEDIAAQGMDRPAAGPLLTDPQHIAEQSAQRRRRQGHPGGGVAVPQLPPAAQQRVATQSQDQPQDSQQVEQKLRHPPMV